MTVLVARGQYSRSVYHRGGGDGKPLCSHMNRDTEWRKVTPRQVITYEFCERCAEMEAINEQ